MKLELQLKLQAYLDGELPDGEARAVAEWLNQDAEARALLAELNHTSAALAGFESEIKLPESREFYWSKIEREIRRLESPPRAAPQRHVFAALRRFLFPAGALAGLLIAGLLAIRGFSPAEVVQVETRFADAGALTYRDQANRLTLVWLPYPADNEAAEDNRDRKLQ